MAKKDYQELEGKEIIYIDGNIKTPAIVTGCNFDIGLTVVARDDHDHYLICGNGPSSPNPGRFSEKDLNVHKAMFYSHVRAIKKGFVNSTLVDTIYKACDDPVSILSSGPSFDNCPFGQ